MKFWFKHMDGILYAYITGEVDMMIADPWRKAIEQELQVTLARNLVFDFSEVSFIDSSGLGVIMGRYRNVACRGGQVCIQGANVQVYKILQMSGLENIIKIIPPGVLGGKEMGGN